MLENAVNAELRPTLKFDEILLVSPLIRKPAVRVTG